MLVVFENSPVTCGVLVRRFEVSQLVSLIESLAELPLGLNSVVLL